MKLFAIGWMLLGAYQLAFGLSLRAMLMGAAALAAGLVMAGLSMRDDAAQTQRDTVEEGKPHDGYTGGALPEVVKAFGWMNQMTARAARSVGRALWRRRYVISVVLACLVGAVYWIDASNEPHRAAARLRTEMTAEAPTLCAGSDNGMCYDAMWACSYEGNARQCLSNRLQACRRFATLDECATRERECISQGRSQDCMTRGLASNAEKISREQRQAHLRSLTSYEEERRKNMETVNAEK